MPAHLTDLDGLLVAGKTAIVARARAIDAEWVNGCFDDPRGITSSLDALAFARTTGLPFVCFVLCSDLGTSTLDQLRTCEWTAFFAQPYGAGDDYDVFVGRVESFQNRMAASDLTVTIDALTLSMRVTDLESGEPFSVVVDADNGSELLGMVQSTTIRGEVELCV